MKKLALVVLVGIFASANVWASDIEVAYVRFDELRSSDASAADKAFGAFEYFSLISRLDVKPVSYEGCLKSIQSGVRTTDPCMPVSARAIEGGAGTGGVD